MMDDAFLITMYFVINILITYAAERNSRGYHDSIFHKLPNRLKFIVVGILLFFALPLLLIITFLNVFNEDDNNPPNYPLNS